MFTSRAEHRLMLRHDTADQRLTPRGREAGLIDEQRWEAFLKKTRGLDEIREILTARKLPAPQELSGALCRHSGETLERSLCDGSVSIDELLPFAPALAQYPAEWLEGAALDIKYGGYIEKEKRAAGRNAKLDHIRLSPGLDYSAVNGLCAEAKEKLKTVRPLTLGQAARIPGLRQGDIALLMALVKKGP
jgi:tRNA uridine 5-carboxymethylaminomethyl modification enzyme